MLRQDDGVWLVAQAPPVVRIPLWLLSRPDRGELGIEVVGLNIYFGFPQAVPYRIWDWESSTESLVCQRG